MSTHYHDREIDGQKWTVQEFTASTGLRLAIALAKLLGRPLGKAVGAVQGGTSQLGSLLEQDVNLAAIGDALGELAEKLTEEGMLDLAKRLLSGTMCDGREVLPQFDTLFMRRYGTLLKVLAFVVEVNFDVPLTDWVAGLGRSPIASTPEQSSGQTQT